MAGFVLYGCFDEFVPDASMSFVEAFVVCAVPISIVGAMHLAGGDETAGTVDFDWETRTLSVSRNFVSHSYSFDEIDALSVRAEYRLRGDSSSEVRKERIHQARLDAVVKKKRVMLIGTDSRELIAESAVGQLEPLAKELAISLDKELIIDDPVPQRHKRFVLALLAAPLKLHATFFGLSALAVVWIAFRAGALLG